MQFKPVVFALGLVAAVQAWGTGVVYTTITTDIYTTVCPSPTTFVAGNSTYTVTESTTLTITNCPCTISKPATTTSGFYGNSTVSVIVPTFTSGTGVAITPTFTSGTPTTSSGPGFSANAAPVKEASYGAIAVAGLAAMFL